MLKRGARDGEAVINERSRKCHSGLIPVVGCTRHEGLQWAVRAGQGNAASARVTDHLESLKRHVSKKFLVAQSNFVALGKFGIVPPEEGCKRL